MNELSILVTISVIIFLSPFFSKILKLPITPIEIILGSIAGYFGFIGENHLFEIVAEVGFFYLMFLAGAEVDLRIFTTTDTDIMKRSILYLFLLYFLSFLVISILGISKIFIVIMPMLSVGIILTLFKEYGKEQKWLNLSMFVGTLGEVVSIAILTIVGAMLKFGIGMKLYLSIGYLSIFLLGIVFIFHFLKVLFWWFPEIKILLMPHFDKDEKDIRLSMALFFLMIALMLFLDLEIAFGAFVAGTFIATFFEHKKELPHKLSSFGFGFLVPIFFIYVGSTFELKAILLDGIFKHAAFLTLGMIGVRVASAFVFSKNLHIHEIVLFGLSHSMPLTLLIAVSTIAYGAETISENLYYSFILASLFQVIFSTICIKIIYLMSKRNTKKKEK